MKSILTWLLKKTGIYAYVWRQFCEEYPVRLGSDVPEVKRYLQTQQKVMIDMMTYGMGCTRYVDPRTVPNVVVDPKNVVLH